MVEKVKETVGRIGGDVLINAAVLHRMGLERLCDAVVCVTAPALLRVLRALRRDRRPLREVLSRARSQKDIGAQCNDSGVDTYTVRNWGTQRSLAGRVGRLVRLMKE
jgi:dephospho-CoA kinase